jgi:hypothetical protein
MANALSALGGAPPAPNPQPASPGGGAALTQGFLGPSMGGAPMSTGQGSPQPGGAGGAGPAAPPPPPSHQQTVAAVRHFGAISSECASLLADPDCGKSDVRSKVIDGVTKLVSDGIATPADAVRELASFPDRPFEQKKWLENYMTRSDQAATAVLAHHQMAPQPATPQGDYDPENHNQIMQGLISQYQPAKGQGG